MKRVSLVLAFSLLFVFSGYCQLNLSPQYYIAGTFPDKNGIIKEFPFYNKQIFIQKEKDSLIVRKLELMIKEYNKKRLLNIKQKFRKRNDRTKKGREYIYYTYKSYWMRKMIHRFYNFKRAFPYKHPLGFPIYKGTLKIDEFKKCTIIEKYSYLAGAFLTHGYIEQGKYKYQFSNSESKVVLVDFLLNITGNEVIELKVLETVPAIVEISFVPTEEFRRFIKEEISIRQQFDIERPVRINYKYDK